MEPKSRSIPKFDSRTVFAQGDSIAVTIHKGWLKQHQLSAGDEVYVFLDEDNKRFTLVANDDISKELIEKARKKGLPEETRKIVKQGKSSYSIYIPQDWIKRLQLGKSENMIAKSNNAMSFDVFTPERKEEYHRLLGVEI